MIKIKKIRKEDKIFMLYYSLVDTEEKKNSNAQFCKLRDELANNGTSIHYDSFKVKDLYFSVRLVYYKKRIYLMKRCNKRCIEIIDLMEEYKNIKNKDSSVDK